MRGSEPVSAVEQAKNAIGTVTRSFPVRVWQRYGDARGNVLAGGIAYFAFFSIFPALAVGLTVLGLVMRNTPEVRDVVVDNLIAGVDQYAPGLVHRGTKPPEATGIYIDEFIQGTALTWSLVVSTVTFLFTGLGWMDGMRQGIRAVFGDDPGDGNVVAVRLRDLLGMVVVGFGVGLSVASVVATNGAGGYLLDLMGFEPSTWSKWLLTVLGFVVAFAIDTGTFLLVFRVLPNADVPVRDLLQGALLGGIGLGLLKQFGTSFARRSAEGNAFLGAAATLVVLLVLMNLISRLILLAAAWAATRADDAGTLRPDLMAEARLVTPLGPEPAPRQEAAAHKRSFLSGVLLGAAATGAGLLALLRRNGRRGRR
ncbi:YihY/virulence factor BrkB family protein [Kineococcus sp. SYSU DK001]|uniref:YihY/virulence factor BrkB family protein n=1 Tax=Kineococcus sp. SYSU DK001 TaxID=3383122 RepID=UPI003D7EE98D